MARLSTHQRAILSKRILIETSAIPWNLQYAFELVVDYMALRKIKITKKQVSSFYYSHIRNQSEVSVKGDKVQIDTYKNVSKDNLKKNGEVRKLNYRSRFVRIIK